jgi:glycosyltransferase involved in cell wall biosynthesis
MELTLKAVAPADFWVALLGKGQVDADGVEDYCRYLGQALSPRGVSLAVYRLDWERLGWARALAQLRRESRDWHGRWVIVQYTALAFSSRGFPIRALRVLRILRRNGARIAVVFHDPFRHDGRRLRDRVRGEVQDWVIRWIFDMADAGIFPDPLTKIGWLPRGTSKAFSIPIGANIPEPTTKQNKRDEGNLKTIVVFCLSLDTMLAEELRDLAISAQVACARGASFRLLFLGRGTEEARGAISTAFSGIPIEFSVLGLLKPDMVAEKLASADAMLCVRGMLYPRRGSAIAGIACGLPILGYAGAADGTAVAEAGVLLVRYRDAAALGEALARLLIEPAFAEELRRRSTVAYKKYFSWDGISEEFLRAMRERSA